MAGVSRALRILGVIWFVAFVSALPVGVFMTVAHLNYPPEAGAELVNQTISDSAFCTIEGPKGWPLFELATILFFILPMILLSLLYIRIGIRIRRTSLGRGSNTLSGTINQPNASKRTSSRKNALRMLGNIVFPFRSIALSSCVVLLLIATKYATKSKGIKINKVSAK